MSNTNESKEKKMVMDAYNPVGLPVPDGFDLNQMIGEYEEQGNPAKKFKYMPASARIAWFRANEPDSPMPVTELIKDNNDIVLFKATLLDKDGNIRATATGADSFANHSQNEVHKAYESAETKAIGRCLRFLGYGIGIKDEGDEKDPIDQPTPTKPIEALNEMIDNDEEGDTNKNTSSTTTANAKTFADMTDLEKGVAVVNAPFPITIQIAGVNYKNEKLYKIMQTLRNSGAGKNAAEDIQKKLQWGLNSNLKGILNKEINLAYPEYAKFVIAMLNDLEFYNKVIKEVKTQLHGEKAA